MPAGTTRAGFAFIMAVTFGLALFIAGAIWLVCWIMSLGVLAVLRAFNPSHPITAEEDID